MRRPAFTLIEIMVVVVVVAILSAMAIPSMVGSQRRAELRTQSDRLVETLRYARRMAVLQGRTLRVVLVVEDPEQARRSSYHLEVATTDLDEPQAFQKATGGSVKPAVLPDTVRLEGVEVTLDQYAASPEGFGQRSAIHFRPDGSADAALLSLGNGQQSQRIVVDATSGRVTRLTDPDAVPPAVREDLDA